MRLHHAACLLAAAVLPAGTSAVAPFVRTLAQGAALRIGSDMTGGLPLELIKTRLAMTGESPLAAARGIARGKGGLFELWRGTPARLFEGALMGACLFAGSTTTKSVLLKFGAEPTLAALCGGAVGGVAQTVVMGPTALLLTTGLTNGKTMMENAKAIVARDGPAGLYLGSPSICFRQATNWASRQGITEAVRPVVTGALPGIAGEVASGCIGGCLSVWNTPLEAARVRIQGDNARGIKGGPSTTFGAMKAVYDERGLPALFLGVGPRACQASWQTVWMVVVPTVLATGA